MASGIDYSVILKAIQMPKIDPAVENTMDDMEKIASSPQRVGIKVPTADPRAIPIQITVFRDIFSHRSCSA